MISLGDNLNEMSKAISRGKVGKSIINLLSAEFAQRVVKVKSACYLTQQISTKRSTLSYPRHLQYLL